MHDATHPLIDRCHHPLVRDLAWLLSTPDLVVKGWPPRPGPAELGLASSARQAAFMDRLEAAPEALEQHVGDGTAGRMGLYHERLWQFLLANAPGTQLMGHNLRVTRDRLTLGELDLLYQRRNQDQRCGQVELNHLEVAIKFYLGLPDGPGDAHDPARWIGPGGADSLAGKLAHLRHHQLRLTEQPETRAAIRDALAHRPDAPPADIAIRRRLALPGVLFQPWPRCLPPPRAANADHLHGIWLPWSQWRRYRHGLAAGTHGARLRKPHWLALPRRDRLLPLATLETALDEHFRQTPVPLQIALWHPRAGWRRVFLVADDWPQQVPLPPWRPPLP